MAVAPYEINIQCEVNIWNYFIKLTAFLSREISSKPLDQIINLIHFGIWRCKSFTVSIIKNFIKYVIKNKRFRNF